MFFKKWLNRNRDYYAKSTGELTGVPAFDEAAEGETMPGCSHVNEVQEEPIGEVPGHSGDFEENTLFYVDSNGTIQTTNKYVAKSRTSQHRFNTYAEAFDWRVQNWVESEQ